MWVADSLTYHQLGQRVALSRSPDIVPESTFGRQIHGMSFCQTLRTYWCTHVFRMLFSSRAASGIVTVIRRAYALGYRSPGLPFWAKGQNCNEARGRQLQRKLKALS
jgi:hypothetical protein